MNKEFFRIPQLEIRELKYNFSVPFFVKISWPSGRVHRLEVSPSMTVEQVKWLVYEGGETPDKEVIKLSGSSLWDHKTLFESNIVSQSELACRFLHSSCGPNPPSH
jgi:hypothetical protein